MGFVKDMLRPLLGPAWRRFRLARAAGALHRTTLAPADDGAYFDAVFATDDFRPLQKRNEFTTLMSRLSAIRPRTLMEIGAAAGGTAFLLTRIAAPDALIVLLDDSFAPARQAALRRFARSGQRIVCLRGDSHSPDMARSVRAALAGRPLDFLFIDGDHRYEGVAADFATFSPLVRQGGLVAFHDIVPDHAARHGAATVSDAGGVPRFWKEIAARTQAEEIVESWEQDGCGIGLLTKG